MPNLSFKYFIIALNIFCVQFLNSSASTHQSPFNSPKHHRIVFYNLENLFDIYDDPITNDDEFTPQGSKGWSNYRYKKKLNDLAKVIIAVGEWNPPSIVGLCEVENFQVLLDLITKTPLASLNYQIVHENSNDTRGIDVALIYRPERVTKISHSTIRIKNNDEWKTRDILYAQMQFDQKDTIHFFINHWPSRYGGKEVTESKRITVAKTLRANIDSIIVAGPNQKVMILGDFNDEPNNASISDILGASSPKNDIIHNQFYNLSYEDFRAGLGTLVYKEINNTWFLFDQIIVSGSLINGNGIASVGRKSTIFDTPWIMVDKKPYRTYQGPIYKGGFSDHLPIFIDLYKND